MKKAIKNYTLLLKEGLPHFFEAVSYMKAVIVGGLIIVIMDLFLKNISLFALVKDLTELTIILVLMCIFIGCPIIAADKKRKNSKKKISP